MTFFLTIFFLYTLRESEISTALMSNIVSNNSNYDFSQIANEWWDINGPMKPLHKLNPQRIAYIAKQAERIGGLKGKKVLDIGCGGGLVSEPLCRLGANVTGIDVQERLIEIAQAHAKEQNLNITYKCTELDNMKGKFDIITLLEVVEHVDDPTALIKQATELLKPGGILVLSTLNRTLKSLALGKVAAEYILRWVPNGTHDWKMFIKPSELVGYAQKSGVEPVDTCGLTYHPIRDEFALNKSDLSINYFLTCQKP